MKLVQLPPVWPKLLVQQLEAAESQPPASDGRRVCWFEAAAVAGTAVEPLGVEAELAEVERTGVAVVAAAV